MVGTARCAVPARKAGEIRVPKYASCQPDSVASTATGTAQRDICSGLMVIGFQLVTLLGGLGVSDFASNRGRFKTAPQMVGKTF